MTRQHSDIVELQVEGMDCNNCAASIERYLTRQGMQDVYVNFQTKEVRYRPGEEVGADAGAVVNGIQKLGYKVIGDGGEQSAQGGLNGLSPHQRLIVCAVLTLPLLLGHFLMMAGLHLPWLANGWVQFGLALPVYLVGGLHFGRSALAGLRQRMLNMDVLIFLGATAAFVYSLVGLYWEEPHFYFFETAATIITLVLVGNWLEARAVRRTTTAIGALSELKEARARIVMPSGTLVSLPTEEVRVGAKVRLATGDKVPLDGRLPEDAAPLAVNESMLTGESLPVDKGPGDELIGGSLVLSGQATYTVTAPYRNGTLARIIELVKNAQADRPDIQRLADRVSAVFVPVVIALAVLTFLVGWLTGYATATQALMNAIAVLLISCPCAMGLATPTAIMVGVGRLARTGVLIRGGSTVERLTDIEQMVFDKTGTLTTGELQVTDFQVTDGEDPARIRRLIYEIEGYSSHPIAQSVRRYLGGTEMLPAGAVVDELPPVRETAGLGLRAGDYYLGTPRGVGMGGVEADVVLTHQDRWLASFRLTDEARTGVRATLQQLSEAGIRTVMLTGDRRAKAERLARELGIDEVYAEQRPAAKLRHIKRLSAERPTAMVGDGINDAAALSRADVGISLGGASAAALDAARVVLMRDDLSLLPEARRLSELTVRTIRESLFWAFSYNVVAIPLAALGFLSPMWAALFMAFSDVVVIGNAIRLRNRD